MKSKSVINCAALAAVFGFLSTQAPLAEAQEVVQVKRPPLYVMFAFDGSRSLDMWQETRDFSVNMNKANKPVKFTYFINSVYYIASQFKNKYNAPQGGPGKSAIGFGGTTDDVKSRFVQTNSAHEDGHEIANHAAGHFDGSKWSYNQWDSEIRQFFDMMFDKFLAFNGLKTYPSPFDKGWKFLKSEMVGFRAPQLGLNNAMYSVLQQNQVKYDTSKSGAPNLWPQKSSLNIWNFPLAEIQVAGTKRRTLSMDYNFYYVDSKGSPNAANAKTFENRMYQSYMKYIQDNYNGNRAPINIGHHFSKWNGGAYWNAMKRVVADVCGLPEVKCVTYKEFMNTMETLDPKTIQAYQKSQFPKLKPVKMVEIPESAEFLKAGLLESVEEDYFIADPPEAHEEHND